MPRQSRGSAPSRRPMAPPARPAAPAPKAVPQQSRPASTAVATRPAAVAPPAAQASQGPGIFGSMASTFAGAAIGSSVGHAIGSLFTGGSSAPVEQQSHDNATMQSTPYQSANVCQNDISAFKQCMDQNDGSLTICGWYLDQLKACQAAAKQY